VRHPVADGHHDRNQGCHGLEYRVPGEGRP
jgi:hypothetical protein